MFYQGHKSKTKQLICVYSVLAALIWSSLCGGFVYLSDQFGKDALFSDAQIMASTSIEKEIIFLHSSIEKGSGNTGPPVKNISSNSQKNTPQDFKLPSLIQSHIIMRSPVHPENKADAWEVNALEHIAEGAKSYWSLWEHEGAPAYRFLRPLMAEASCFQCHKVQNEEEMMHLGISTIVPLANLMAAKKHQQQHMIQILSIIWLIGLLGIVFSWRRFTRLSLVVFQERDNIKRIFDVAPNGMLLFNSRAEVLLENSEFRDKFCRATSCRGRRFGEIINCEHAAADPRGCSFSDSCSRCSVQEALQGSLKNGSKTINQECRIHFQDRPSQTFLFSTVPLTFDGENVALLSLFDISQQRLAEQEREKIQAQLLQSQKIESIGRLAGGVAHDFNNMTAIISGNVDLALHKHASGISVEKHLLQIKNAAIRSAGLTRQLLGFARKQTIIPQSLDLNIALKEMLSMLKSLIGEDIELVWSPAKHPLQILIDPTQLDQILTNLLVNARDAMSTQGRLEISTNSIVLGEDYTQTHPWCPPGEYVQLRVQDNGCGIPTEVIDHIFEPFFTTKEQGKGTGLGLATVYGIVKQNNGSIDVDSFKNQGTTVSIYFPQKLPEDTVASMPAEETLLPGDESILLVEDDETLLDVTQQILEGLGYHVIATENAETALELATTMDKPIDLLLTDVIMPKLNGRELAEQIQKIQPQLKVLYISGYATDVISTRGLLGKDVQLLQKPFSSEALALKVRELLESKKD